MIVLTPAEMSAADAQVCDAVGASTLMMRAGKAIAGVARRLTRGDRVVAFAGRGNNGGDAFAALAELDGFERAIFADDAPQRSEARANAEQRAREAGVHVSAFPRTRDDTARALEGAGVVIVGLVGTAARYPLPDSYAQAIEAINASGVPAIAIDIPPGVDGENGVLHDPALRARATVTLGATKSGLLLCEDAAVTGEILVDRIGMPADVLAAHARTFGALDRETFARMLPHRAAGADKRSSGAPLIIAGSQQFPGAAVLCAMGAARSGAGYVTVATPAAAASTLRAHLIEQVVVEIDANASPGAVVDDLLDTARRCSSVAIGPGLGLDDRTGEIVRSFVQRCTLPIVADASALFHFAKFLDALRGKPLVVTPHEGEFARLSGKGTIAPGERVARLREFVDRTGVTTLLKGARTLVYDGNIVHINTTGTPALATAGTGDVLTGVIATLLSQGLSPTDAAKAGAYWHGLAGQRASQLRPRGVIARDVYDALSSSS